MQLLVFGYAATFDLENVRLVVLNEDRGSLGRELVSRFERSVGFEVIGFLQTEDEIRPLIDSTRALMALGIGEVLGPGGPRRAARCR